MYQYLAVIDTEIVHFLPKYPFFLANTSFLQRKYMIWYRRPLRQARLTTKLPLFNTKIPFFLANASFLQRKHTIWYLRRARLTTKLFGSYFVQIKLVALLSTISVIFVICEVNKHVFKRTSSFAAYKMVCIKSCNFVC